MNRYCDDYLHFLALEKNASRNTIASYRLDIGRYVRFLEMREIGPPGRHHRGDRLGIPGDAPHAQGFRPAR
jgi:site-specific recombinase XerD